MVWYFLGGFALCYILSLVVIFLCDPIDGQLVIIYTAPITIPCVIVGLPFYVIYRVFFRLTVKVVPVENIKRAAKSDDRYTIRHVFGKIYLWHDKQASKFWNKFFFLRSTDHVQIQDKAVVF